MLTILIINLSILISVSFSECTEEIEGWFRSYCPEDITRIEYQIAMDDSQLAGNTVNQIDLFVDWMVTNLQNNIYQNYLRLSTEKIKKYYRTKDELTIVKMRQKWRGITGFINSPIVSSIKYRQSFGNFKMNDSVLKYQNDFTWETHMTAPGTDFNYTAIEPQPEYADIYSSKLEPNVFVDACIENGLSTGDIIYGEDTTSFSAKIEFDEDEAYGTNDTNGITMVDTSSWSAAGDPDAFYCDCSDPSASCICCDIEEFFPDFCSYYKDDATVVEKQFPFDSGYHYILDIDFYWHKNGNLSSQETSKGKFTFQVQYDSINDLDNDIPSGRATELSMKLYKSKTVDGEWDNLVEFSEELIDIVTSQSSGSATWIDHRSCSLYCCINYASSAQKWKDICQGPSTQTDCEDVEMPNGDQACQWIRCDEVGSCIWSGIENPSFEKRCPMQTTRDNCEAMGDQVCVWAGARGGPPLPPPDAAKSVSMNPLRFNGDGDGGYDWNRVGGEVKLMVVAVVVSCFVSMIVVSIAYCVCIKKLTKTQIYDRVVGDIGKNGV